MPIELSVLNPAQVASPSSFEVLVDSPAKRLVIFSGIAVPEFWTNHDEETRTDEIRVHLNYYVEKLESAVVHVGLAAISNDETNFAFVLFSSKVYADDTTGELILSVPAAILGEETLINRFGYQVVAHVQKIAARISGSILLPREILKIDTMSRADVAALFVITANRIDKVAGGFPTLTPLAIGKIDAVRPSRQNIIDYSIDACPLHTPLQVDVALAGALAIPGVAIGQVAGPRPVTLTNIQPDANGIHFSVGRLPPVP